MKKKLQEVTEYKVMSVEDAMRSLGFTWEEKNNSYENITCSCGEKATLRGIIGCEQIICHKCKKEILDLSSPIQTSNSACTILPISEYEVEDDKYWIAIDENGGIKKDIF